MAEEVIMPKLGLTMEEGLISAWLKDVGDDIKKGEPLLEIETDKIVSDVEAPASGILLFKVAEEGKIVAVTEVIGYIGEEGEDIPNLKVETSDTKIQGKKDTPEITREFEITEIKQFSGGIKATPAARSLARKKGIDLEEVKPTGPDGRRLKRDVIRVAEEITNENDRETRSSVSKDNLIETIKLKGIRKSTAVKMFESTSRKPQVTLIREVIADALLNWKNRLNNSDLLQEKISLTTLIVKICGQALTQYPAFNAHIQDNSIRSYKHVNIGVAVALDEGLIVPVIKNVDTKSLKQINGELCNLVYRAKESILTVEELSGSTFTVSNLGSYEIDAFTPIVNPPEIGILGIGRIIRKPVVKNEEIVKASILTLSLTFDHRAVDGAPAAEFLQRINHYIENPELVVL